MPKIIPIRELKNTASISKYVEETNEPVFVTKNGYGSMVIMSLEVYEREFAKKQIIGQINDSLEDKNHSSQKNEDIMLLNTLFNLLVKNGKFS